MTNVLHVKLELLSIVRSFTMLRRVYTAPISTAVTNVYSRCLCEWNRRTLPARQVSTIAASRD